VARFVGIRAGDVIHDIREAYGASGNDSADVFGENYYQRYGRSELIALERFILQPETNESLAVPSPFNEQSSEEDDLENCDHEEIPNLRSVTKFIFSS
jgi:hypothetical protein